MHRPWQRPTTATANSTPLSNRSAMPDVSSEKVTDPVCGMTVQPSKAAGNTDLHGTTHFFCSAGCKRKFDANPGLYFKPSTSSPAAPVADPPPSIDPVCGMKVDSAKAAAT